MNFVNEEIITQRRVSVTNLLQEIGTEEVRKEIISGLTSGQRSISSKFFYNKKGSELFEEITHLQEYYPTRTEKGILKQIAPGLMNRYRGFEIIELGPGDHSKISILLNASDKSDPIRYIPLDISQPSISASAESLAKLFPHLEVEGYAVDFTSQFDLIQREHPVMICFFGSTIGNFTWNESLELLQNIGRKMKTGDLLLLGMDRIKPEPLLHAAYNDARGITALFNKNILNCVNELIQSDFHTGEFDHLAFFNREHSRIEMHLVANRNLIVRSPYFQRDLHMMKGETIHTENSHKYSEEHIQQIVERTELKLDRINTDERGWFAVTQFSKRVGP